MKTLYILLLVFFTNFVAGQKKEIFRDDFNNNLNRWSEAKETYTERFFRGGQYYIINSDTQKLSWNSVTIPIDTNENFIIETAVSLNWEKEGGAYLIFGGDRNSGNFHAVQILNIKGKNSFFVGKMIDGQWTGIWKNPRLKNFGQLNKLEVRKKNNKLHFYLNDSLIYSKDFEAFFGNETGVGCSSPQNISYDYLTVKQDRQTSGNTYVYETNRVNNDYRIAKTEIKLSNNGGVYEVPVELNGVLKIDFIFDSGASEVSISPDIALTLIRTGTIKESDWLPGAYYKFADGSRAKSARFKLKSVKIGEKIAYDVECSISNSLDAPMLLGQSVLKKFGKYTFDYSSNKLIIE